VLYAVTIMVTYYHFTWFSVVISLDFKTLKPLAIVSEGSAINERMRKNDSCGKVIYLELFGENCMKVINTGQKFFLHIMSYQGFRNNQVNCMNFSSLRYKFKPKFKISRNFELKCFKLTRSYCILYSTIFFQPQIWLAFPLYWVNITTLQLHLFLWNMQA
jgi:hypothetical protein